MKHILLALTALVLFSMLTTASFAEECPIIIIPNGTTPTIDGAISAGEWDDANSVTFSTSGGTCTVYFKHNGTALHFAFDVPNRDIDSAVQIFVDPDNNDGTAPQTDDYRFTIQPSGAMGCNYGQNQGTGSDWSAPMTDCDPHGTPCGWYADYQESATTWSAEFELPFAKLGIAVGGTVGITFWNGWGAAGNHYWPTGADWLNPSGWGTGHISSYGKAPVGGFMVPVDKLGLLAPYIGLASMIIVGTVATIVYVKRKTNK